MDPIRYLILDWKPMKLELLPVRDSVWAEYRKGDRVEYHTWKVFGGYLVRTPLRTKTGLRFYYPGKSYVCSARMRILAPDNLDSMEYGIVRIEVMKTVTKNRRVLQITILPPRNLDTRKVKRRLVLKAIPRTDGEAIEVLDSVEFAARTTNYDPQTGRGIDYIAIVARINQVVRIRVYGSGGESIVTA